MHITQINIQGLEFETTREILRGCVALISSATRFQVDCALHDSADTSDAQRRSALVDEAIRQLKRMPEFRRNQDAVSVADGLLAA